MSASLIRRLAMVLSPLLEQHLDVRLYQSKRSHDINVSHPLCPANGERLVLVRQIDHHDRSGLENVNGCLTIIIVSQAVNPLLNMIFGVLAALFVGLTLWRLLRFRRMADSLEVSPFNLTEISHRGVRRVLPWRQSLELRNRLHRGCVEIGPPGTHTRYGSTIDFSSSIARCTWFWRMADSFPRRLPPNELDAYLG
jgi:hypothetical protein